MSDIKNSIQKLKQNNISHLPLDNDLTNLFEIVQQISQTSKEFNETKSQHNKQYFSNVKCILKDIQQNLQAQHFTKVFDPALIPVTQQNLLRSLNFTKQTENQSQEKLNQLKQLFLSIQVIKQRLLDFQSSNNEQIKSISDQISQNENICKQKQSQIQNEQLYLKDEKYQQLNNISINIQSQIEQTSKKLELLNDEQKKLSDLKISLEKDLKEFKQLQQELKQKEQDLLSQIQKYKIEYEEMQKKQQKEKETLFQKVKNINNTMISEDEDSIISYVLLDKNNKNQSQQQSLIEFCQRQKNFELKYFESQFYKFPYFQGQKPNLKKLFESLQEKIQQLLQQKQNSLKFYNLILLVDSEDQVKSEPNQDNKGLYKCFESQMKSFLKKYQNNLKIIIFDQYNSEQSIFKNFFDFLQQEQYSAKFFFKFQDFLQEVQNSQKSKNTICHQQLPFQDFMKNQFNKEQQEIQNLEKFLLSKHQKQEQVTKQYDYTYQQLQIKSELTRNVQNEIEDLKEKNQQLQHQFKLKQENIQFFIKQYQDDLTLSQVVPIKQLIQKLSSQLQNLQNLRIDIDNVLSQLSSLEKKGQITIQFYENFIFSAQNEVKRLFSLIWQLKGKSSSFLILFSLFFQNNKFELNFNSSNNLSALLQIDLEKAEQFNSQIEFDLVEDIYSSQVTAQIKPKTNFTNEEFIQLFDKLNQMISTKQVSECCNSIKKDTYDSYESFNQFLNTYIQDMN
ncbi:hypothetical protein ABPG72_013667 [Tetrahymena utriculariae]